MMMMMKVSTVQYCTVTYSTVQYSKGQIMPEHDCQLSCVMLRDVGVKTTQDHPCLFMTNHD